MRDGVAGSAEAHEASSGELARLLYGTLTGRFGAKGNDLAAKLRAFVEAALPRGVVTFFLGDVEGSTRMWEHDSAATAKAMETKDELVGEIIVAHGGLLPRDQGEGDSFCAVFEAPSDAAAAAIELQRSLHSESWPAGADLKVRTALHSGEAQLRGGNYYGLEVNRCARIRSLAHGGQILMSRFTNELVNEGLPDRAWVRCMGTQRLRDLTRPEEVFQLLHPDLPRDFPPLRTENAAGLGTSTAMARKRFALSGLATSS